MRRSDRNRVQSPSSTDSVKVTAPAVSTTAALTLASMAVAAAGSSTTGQSQASASSGKVAPRSETSAFAAFASRSPASILAFSAEATTVSLSC